MALPNADLEQAVAKGKSKTGGRSGSDSGNNSRSSASDLKHDKKQLRSEKRLEAGTDPSGSLSAGAGRSDHLATRRAARAPPTQPVATDTTARYKVPQ